MEYFMMFIAIGMLVLVLFAMYNVFIKKKKIGNLYTPYDDATRGTIDSNRDKFLKDDTNHFIPYEEITTETEMDHPNLPK